MPRADAAENRARILDVARRALADSSDATLHSIAQRAGVGQGTLYRHFASREELLVAAYEDDLRQVLDLAPQLLSAHAPPAALRAWLDRLAAYGRIKREVLAAVATTTYEGLSRRYRDETLDLIETFLAAGRDTGELRTDVTAEDVLALVGFLWRLDDDDREQRVARLLDVVVAGLSVTDRQRT